MAAIAPSGGGEVRRAAATLLASARLPVLSVRLLVVEFAPFAKRLFWWSPELYGLLALAPLLAVLRWSFSGPRLAAGGLALGWLAAGPTPEQAVAYLPLVLLLAMLPRLDFDEIARAIWRLRLAFALSVAYGAFQDMFGYLPFELAWIASGLGAVSENGYFVTDDIRAFSFYSGVPEFGFFSVVVGYVAYRRGSLPFVALALAGLVLSGSRGVIVSTAIAIAAVPIARSIGARRATWVAAAAAVFVYILLAVALPAYEYLVAGTGTRMFVYGTFNARVLTLLDFVAHVTPVNVLYGVRASMPLYDNLYLTLINDFGIVAVVAMVAWLTRSVTGEASMVFAVVTLSYCLYADALLSIHFAYPALLLVRARGDVAAAGGRA